MGETLTYQVDNIQVVKPEDIRALDIDSNEDYCTLVTCTPYGINTHRLLVRGRRVENAANTGWDIGCAGAKRLDKVLIIALFMIPAVPVFLAYAIVKCVKIHKKGKIRP
jgi:sortase A